MTRHPSAMDRASSSLNPREREVLAMALLRGAQQYGVSTEELFQVVGVREGTLKALRRGSRELVLHDKQVELALLFLRVFRSLDVLVGGEDKQAAQRLRAHNHPLRGVPVDRMKGIEGLVRVAEYLDAMRGGVYPDGALSAGFSRRS